MFCSHLPIGNNFITIIFLYYLTGINSTEELEELTYGKVCSPLGKEGVYIGKMIPGGHSGGHHALLVRNTFEGKVFNPSVVFFRDSSKWIKGIPIQIVFTGYKWVKDSFVPKKDTSYANALLDKYIPLEKWPIP